jgi:diacylglycerol O-acyltransferase / wax synthase
VVVRTDGGDRLSAADASNVLMDARDQVNVFLMAGLLGPGGFVSQDGAADISRLRMGIAERLGEGAGVGLSRLAERVRADRRGLVWEHSNWTSPGTYGWSTPWAGRPDLRVCVRH